jgi:2-keto-4-pentenoate hydratase/2-oxohepta-3-ene-1,7-dioic acid hydratase in catechol pathway
MKDLIVRYDAGLRARIVEAVRVLAASSAVRPPWAYDLAQLKVLPPVMPMTMMNVAVNYREHDIEMAAVRAGSPGAPAPTGGEALPGTVSAPGIWDRESNDPRWNPFMFLKATAAIIADGEAVRIPPERTRIEWECEMALVIGRTATSVPVELAYDYIFGYTLQNDVSDRGGRGDTRYGSDWLVTKSHDTFAPLGPFILPKEFVPDAHDLALSFSLNGEVLQQGHTAEMIHKVPELVAYGSSILTLRPGDVIATGTTPGSGSARTPPVFFKDGDVSVCTYERIGTLTNPIQGPGE